MENTTSNQKQFVTYYRVSTVKQGQSGLGLEAQRATAEGFVKGRGIIVAEYVEIESGKKDNRPKLRAAIEQANATGATLLIAKLDRLARNASFIFALRDAGVDFQACDLPEANTLTIGIFAVMAQHEREMISARTRAALQARKARGLTLGTPANLNDAARLKGMQARQANAREAKENRQAAELVSLYRAQGHTLRNIAKKLNASGYVTRSKKPFAAETVRRLLRMAPIAA